MITVAAYDRHVEQLFELLRRLHAALTKAEVDCRMVRDGRASVAQDFGFGYQAAAGIALEKWAANLDCSQLSVGALRELDCPERAA